MTVNNQTSKITYNGNGSTTVWTFPFVSDDPSSIFLFITDALGHINQVPVGQYTVTLNAPIPPNPTSLGGTVIYPIGGPALAAGNKLSIVRLTPDLQNTSITNQSIIYPPIVEQEFDYRTMIDQQLQEMIARSVKVGIADDPLDPLPPKDLRKNQQAVFDNDGNLVAGGAVVGTIVSAAMIPVVTAVTLPLARTAMGVPPIDSPTFTGDPKAPLPPPLDNDASIATTQWVQDFVSINGGGFPSGTKMLFQQVTPPAGWVTDTTHNDKALRVVSAFPGAAGVVPFSTVFGGVTTGQTTLSIAEIPIHAHGVTDGGHSHSGNLGVGRLWAETNGTATQVDAGSGPSVAVLGTNNFAGTTADITGISIQNNGGSQPHTHPMDMRVQYVDVIIAVKS